MKWLDRSKAANHIDFYVGSINKEKMPQITIPSPGNVALNAAVTALAFIGMGTFATELALHGANQRRFSSDQLERLRTKVIGIMKDSTAEGGDSLQEEANIINNAIAMVNFQIDMIVDAFRENEGLGRRLKD